MSNKLNLTNGGNRNSGISLPKSIMARIDAVKHPDTPRSKFVLRILETALNKTEVVGPLAKDNPQPAGCHVLHETDALGMETSHSSRRFSS